MKICAKCKIEKSTQEFYQKQSRCKDCAKKYLKEYRQSPRGKELRRKYESQSIKYKEVKRRVDRKWRYGITKEVFDQMMLSQSGECYICGILFSRETREAWVSVDHSHKTGKIRGLLCASCNLGLAGFKDNPILLTAAIRYLKEKNE